MRLACKIVIALVILVVLLNVSVSDARRRKKNQKTMLLRQKETNAVNFIRLAVMRLIYGVATRFGYEEQISEALNGAFVPPGADDYDYDREGDGLFGDDDDYDY